MGELRSSAFHFFMVAISHASILSISQILFNRPSSSVFVMNQSLWDKIICVSSSDADHFAIYKKFVWILVKFLWFPSAMFEGIDTEHLLIWLVNP